MHPERIQRLARSERVARHTGFWWGLAEGLAFFIVPDVYISFAVLFSVRAGAMAWLFSIVGSVVAIPIIYILVTISSIDYVTFLETIPGISRALLERVEEGLLSDGLQYTPLLALGGVPLKVYGALAFSIGLSLGQVLVWTVFARFVRIAPTYIVVAGIRKLLHRHIDGHSIVWTGALILFWVVFYVFYLWRMGQL